jgi:hypothetical protein
VAFHLESKSNSNFNTRKMIPIPCIHANIHVEVKYEKIIEMLNDSISNIYVEQIIEVLSETTATLAKTRVN